MRSIENMDSTYSESLKSDSNISNLSASKLQTKNLKNYVDLSGFMTDTHVLVFLTQIRVDPNLIYSATKAAVKY